MDSLVTIRFGDLITLFLYFTVTVWIGYWCSRRMNSTEGYFVGSRQVPGWAVGFSMLGTAISSVTFLAYPGSAYSGNWSLLVPGLTLPIVTIVAVYLFVPFYRRFRYVTAFEYLEHRFGAWARVYAGLMWSIHSSYRMGIILFLIALLVRKMTGMDIYEVILIMGVLVTFYTVVGGIEAVIWTDVIQTVILLLGGLICITTVMIEYPEGVAGLFRHAIECGKFNLTINLSVSFYSETLWVLLLYGLFQNLQEFASDQTKIQRYCAASSDQGARRSVLFSGFGCIPVWMLFMFVGTCLWAFYLAYPEKLPNGIISDDVFPHFILTQIPIGLSGFVIAAAVAAAMSSIDSSMNGVATVVTTDIYRRFVASGRMDRHYLNVARWITAMAGFFMIMAAILVTWIIQHDILEQETILGVGFFIYSVLACGVGGMYFLGFFTKRANSQGVLIGILCAMTVTLWMTLSEFGLLPKFASSPLHRLMINVVSNIVSYCIGYYASYFFRSPDPESIKNLTIHGQQVTR